MSPSLRECSQQYHWVVPPRHFYIDFAWQAKAGSKFSAAPFCSPLPSVPKFFYLVPAPQQPPIIQTSPPSSASTIALLIIPILFFFAALQNISIQI